MKKILLIIALALISGWSNARVELAGTYFRIGDDTYICDKIQTGPSMFRITKTDGTVMKIAADQIDAFSNQGSYFERMPVVDRNLDTAGWAFMQLIASRDGYKLFRYCSNCTHYDPANGTIAPSNPVYRYYIYMNGKCVTVTDDYNTKILLKRFGVKSLS